VDSIIGVIIIGQQKQRIKAGLCINVFGVQFINESVECTKKAQCVNLTVI
jgi:hypothetical protein